MTSTIERRIARVVTTPPPQPGFIGEGHTAVEVLTSADLQAADPFVLLMDDRLDIAVSRRIGGAHPHAGLETVTLLVEGAIHDRDEGTLAEGEVLWMNAGRGVIHNEHVEAGGRSRVLQLWVRLPSADRGSSPSFQLLRAGSIPVRREGGAELRLYSGSSADQRASTVNHAPVTMAEIRLRPGASITQELPSSYNGFLYVLDGVVEVGDTTVAGGQVGWLDRPERDGPSVLTLRAVDGPARAVLYAGEPQREPLVHYGPFVAGSMGDIEELHRRFRRGGFERLSDVAARKRAG